MLRFAVIRRMDDGGSPVGRWRFVFRGWCLAAASLLTVISLDPRAGRADGPANPPSAKAAPGRTPPAGVNYEAEIEYGKGGDRALHLDLARPEKPGGALPTVLVIHGGAWRAGNKRDLTDAVFQLAQKGYAAATVEYRFCPKDRFPAQVEDVKCAVRFLRANAEKYGLNKDRFAAMGFSAGAHLSMMLSTTCKEDGLEGSGGWPDVSSQVQACVSYFGPTDMAATDLGPVSKGLLADFLGGAPSDIPEVYKKASPLTYVSKGDAPMLLFQGTVDPLVPHSQAVKMADAMTKAGVAGRVELLIGQPHGWQGAELSHTIARSFEFLDRHLKGK